MSRLNLILEEKPTITDDVLMRAKNHLPGAVGHRVITT
jgi:hypothetical protein